MKNTLFTFVMLFILLSPVAIAQETESCKSTRNRLAELEKKLKHLKYVTSEESTEKKIKADEKIADILKYNNQKHRSETEMIDEMLKISREYNFNWDSCFKASNRGKGSLYNCSGILAYKLHQDTKDFRFDSYYEKVHELTGVENQIISLREELVSLGCDAINNNENFDYSKVSGTWQSDWGSVQLAVSKSSVTGSWNQSSQATGKITSGSFDAKMKTLKFVYSQPWNKKTGKVTLSFSETPTGYQLSGSWSHDDNTGSGSWGMKKSK